MIPVTLLPFGAQREYWIPDTAETPDEETALNDAGAGGEEGEERARREGRREHRVELIPLPAPAEGIGEKPIETNASRARTRV